MSSGRIVQIIGAVIDVEFPRDQVPNVYDALVVDGKGLTLEVQQQLGDRSAQEDQPHHYDASALGDRTTAAGDD